jgi:hypothetical protein
VKPDPKLAERLRALRAEPGMAHRLPPVSTREWAQAIEAGAPHQVERDLAMRSPWLLVLLRDLGDGVRAEAHERALRIEARLQEWVAAARAELALSVPAACPCEGVGDDDEACDARSHDEGYTCTLPPGHEGEHAACTLKEHRFVNWSVEPRCVECRTNDVEVEGGTCTPCIIRAAGGPPKRSRANPRASARPKGACTACGAEGFVCVWCERCAACRPKDHGSKKCQGAAKAQKEARRARR